RRGRTGHAVALAAHARGPHRGSGRQRTGPAANHATAPARGGTGVWTSAGVISVTSRCAPYRRRPPPRSAGEVAGQRAATAVRVTVVVAPGRRRRGGDRGDHRHPDRVVH